MLLFVFLSYNICSSPEDTSKRTWRLKEEKMALSMLRRCYRFPSTLSLPRLFLDECVDVNRSLKTRIPPLSRLGAAAVVRPYSSDREGHEKNRTVMVVGIPNPFVWFRTRIYYFLIRTYFDTEFSIEEFTEGAKQV